MIDNRQIRAARALLGWDKTHMEKVCGVTRATITNTESGKHVPQKAILEKIRKSLEDHGVEFTSGSGVRMRDESIVVIEGETARQQLLDDVYETMRDIGGEVLIQGVKEADKDESPEKREATKNHIDRLLAAGVKERILTKQGSTNFLAPWSFYRWLPANSFTASPLFIYGDKVAMLSYDAPQKATIISNRLNAESIRHLFNFAWDRAALPSTPESEG